ncbi:hypothetical protein OPIT5_05810 [Opitutaceae bacterium TAV5]|nr:hypothetical protein OPIT5_05810 [Opitutaceae bacterium TAV5]
MTPARHIFNLRFIIAASLLFSTPAFLAAATYTWDGGGDTNFLTPENWNPDGAPVSADDTLIVFTGATNTAPVLNSAFTVKDLSFNTATSFTLSGAGTLSVYGAGTGSVSGNNQGITNTGAGAQAVANDILLTGNAQFYAIGGKLTLSGAINGNGKSLALRSFSNTSRLVIENSISGVSALNFNSSTTGVVELRASNSYTTTSNIWRGTALAAHDSAFGTGEVRLGLNNATAAYLEGTAAVLTDGARTIANNIRLVSVSAGERTGPNIIGGSTAHVSTFSGNILVNSFSANNDQKAEALTLTATAGGRVHFTGNIQRAAGVSADSHTDHLTKTGLGIVALNGSNNTYSGTTTVSEGTLLINGVLASGGDTVTVSSGATLGGSGTVNRAITVLDGATFSAGNIDDDSGASLAGTFTAGAGLALANTATLHFDLGATSDSVSVTGDFTLGGTLNITALEGFGAGTYTLFSYAGGAFVNNGLALGVTPAGFDYELNFATAGQVSLIVTSAIPEPGFIALLVAGAALISTVVSRRLRRNAR